MVPHPLEDGSGFGLALGHVAIARTSRSSSPSKKSDTSRWVPSPNASVTGVRRRARTDERPRERFASSPSTSLRPVGASGSSSEIDAPVSPATSQ
jgi:hypothetical protein